MTLVPQTNLMLIFLLLFMTVCSSYSCAITVLNGGVKWMFIWKLYYLLGIYSSKKILDPQGNDI